jgi:hypothetical protein
MGAWRRSDALHVAGHGRLGLVLDAGEPCLSIIAGEQFVLPF